MTKSVYVNGFMIGQARDSKEAGSLKSNFILCLFGEPFRDGRSGIATATAAYDFWKETFPIEEEMKESDKAFYFTWTKSV